MAGKGGERRSYVRDASGRFSSSPGGGGGKVTGGSLKARSSARRSAAKLAGKSKADTSLSGTLSRRAQKAAATRTGKAAMTARAANRTKLAATSRAVIRPGKANDPVISKAASKARSLRDQADKMLARGNSLMGGGRRDGAAVNVSLGSRARTSETSAGFRGLEMTRKAESLRNRADRIELRAAQSVAKAKREADKPRRTRTDESKRLSRAKQIEKRRSINISNPAGWRADAAGKMAANAARTQQRAMEFYAAAKSRPAVARTTVMPRPEQRAPGQGPMAQALRSTLRSLAQLDAQRIREIESITGMPIRRTASPSKPATNKLPGSAGGAAAGGSGRVSDALRANLRQLAQSDARMVREMADLAKPPPRSQLRGTGGGSQRQLGGGRKRRGKKA